MYGAGVATVTLGAVGDGTNIALARLTYFVDPKTVQGLYGVQASMAVGRLGTRKGDFWVFAAAREKKVLSTIELKSPISATTTAANGTLFVATMKQLFALKKKTE